MKKILFNLVLALSVGVMTQCGGSSSGTDDGDDDTTEVSDNVAATNGTVSAVTDSVSSLVGSFSGGGGALTKASTTDDDEEIEIECNADYTVCTFTCPGGGTMTQSFDDAFEDGECDNGDGTTGYSTTWDTTGTMTFNDCVMEECGTTITSNGNMNFVASGSYDGCLEEWSFEGTFGTIGDNICGGDMTGTPADGSAIAVGFEMNYTASGDMDSFEESLSGQMGMAEADAAECTINEFSSWEELEELIDSGSTCEAAEAAEELDCLTSEDDTCSDDDSDDACDSCMETCFTDNPDASEDECLATCTDDGSCSEDDGEGEEDCLGMCTEQCMSEGGDEATCTSDCESACESM